MGLHRAVLHGLTEKFVLGDEVGLSESGLHVSLSHFQMLADVAVRDRKDIRTTSVILDPFMNQGRIRLHCFPRVKDHWQLLISNLNEGQSLGGYLLSDGSHRSHGLANVAHLFNAHKMGVLYNRAVRLHGDRPAGYNCLYSGQDLGPAGIYIKDAGMGVRTSQYLAEEHSRQLKVNTVDV